MKAQLLIATALLAIAISPLHASTITVSSTGDNGPGTLRNALASASSNDVINFSVGLPATITLTNGELLVTNNLSIIGPGPNNLAINGNAASRVFHIGSNMVVNISSVTISNGWVWWGGTGAGIYNDHAR